MAKKVGIVIDVDSKDLTKLGQTSNIVFNKVSSGAEKASKSFKAFGSSLFSIKGIIAGVGFGLLVNKLKNITLAQAELQDETIKTARAIGIEVESLTSLRRSAELGGAGVEDLDNGIRRLSRNIFDASKGTGEAVKAFDELDIKVTDSEGNLRSVDSVINDIADSFSKLEDGTLKNAQAQLLFGRSGAKLINTLNQGSEALKEQRKEAERLGITFSRESAENAEKFNDALLDLQKTFQGTFREVANDLLPKITPLIKDLTNTIANNKDDIAKFGDNLFSAFKNSLPAIKQLGSAILEVTENYSNFLDRENIKKIAELANEQFEVTKQLKEQEEILSKFKNSGFIPPSVEENVKSLRQRLIEVKQEYKDLSELVSPREDNSPVEANAQNNALISQQNEEFRNDELEKTIEFEKRIAEEQRKFEIKKWGIKAEYEKKKRKEKELTAELELKNDMMVADASIVLAKEVFGANKLFTIAEIGLSTARGIMSALGSTPPNPILAGIIGATGAVQAGKASGIKFADGGMISGAGTNRSDSIPILVSNGESVLNQPATQRLGEDGVNALNSGASIGGNITVNITAGAGADGQSIAQIVLNALEEARQKGLEPSIV